MVSPWLCTVATTKTIWGSSGVVHLRNMSLLDLSKEGTVELNNVRTVAAPHHHVQIHQQLLLLLLVHSGANPLRDRSHTHGTSYHILYLCLFTLWIRGMYWM